MPSTASLADMVDLALGTPEIGCVNYTVLHRFLHAVLTQLHLGAIRADLPNEDEKTFITTTSSASKESNRGRRPPGQGRAGAAATEGTADNEDDGEQDRSNDDKERTMVGSDADSGVTGVTYATDAVADALGTPGQEKDGAEHMRSIPITRTPYHQLEEKVERLESLLRELDELPSNRELLERAKPDGGEHHGDGKPRPVAEMWQSMQLSRKVDANTQGVSKLMSLVEDLMLELQTMKQTNSDLKSEMERSKQTNDLLQNLLQLAGQLEQKMSELSDRVSDEVLEGFVTWSSLEDSLKGLKQDFETITTQKKDYEPVTAQRNDYDFTNQQNEASAAKDLNTLSKELNKLTGDHFTQTHADHAVDQITTHDISSDSLKDLQSRPMSRRRSRRMSTPGPSNDLQDLLERLGKLNEQHEQLEVRVDLLEVEMAKKGDIELLRSLGFSEGLNDQLCKMLEDIDNIKDKHLQDGEYMDRLRKLADTFQVDLEKLNSTVIVLSEDSLKHRDQIEDLLGSYNDLEEKKADKDYVTDELNLKADKENVEEKLSRSQFETACDEINQMINDILTKLLGTQGEWKSALDQLCSDIGGKLDRMEFGPFRDELERQLRAVAKKIASLQTAVGDGRVSDDAAGIRKQLIQHFHCISCDRPLDMTSQKAVPSLPSAPGLPDPRSSRPYIVYELDQIRQQKRGYQWTPQYTEVVDLYAQSRACGGSHTVTYPHRRLVKSSNTGPGGLYPEEPLPQLPNPPPPPYRSDTEAGNFSRPGRTASAAVAASSATSRLPNVHAVLNRQSVRPQARPQSPPQSVRPASAQLSLRLTSLRNDGLVRSRTTILGDGNDSGIPPTANAITDQVADARVPVSHLLADESVLAFQETTNGRAPMVDKVEN